MENSAVERLNSTLNHISPAANSLDRLIETSNCGIPPPPYVQYDESELRWNGWGYGDTEFRLGPEGEVILAGNKYSLSGKTFPKFRSWIQGFVDGIDIDEFNPPQETIEVPEPILNQEFLKHIEGRYGRIEFDKMQRLRHGHGQTAQEVYLLRYSKYERVPDVVIWPISHDQVQFLLYAAAKYNVCVIPYGGGTTVTESLICPSNENRMIVSLDMKMMNKIIWCDRQTLSACIEAGAVGKELDSRLGAMGLTIGHEPDSFEFSTVGGWVATRASGMKKNKYGNIEDLLIHVKIATPAGTISRHTAVPRVSTGPDIQQIIMGSEGILGVITEVTLKLQPLPEARAYGSIVFPDFETGVAFLREVALRRWQPASIRLMDNTQFQMGQMMSPEGEKKYGWVTEPLKELYLTKWAKFDLEQMVACTLLFEGSKKEVDDQQRNIYFLADKYKGISGGENNGRKGYFLTYMIAYLRDYGFGYWLIGESFESAVPWNKVLDVCYTVTKRIEECGDEFELPFAPMCSYRVTQLYDTGACVYFYFGFIFRTLENPVEKFNQIEALARDEVLRCGGSLSHHHGVGKLRSRWMAQCVSPVGIQVLHGIKKTLDPTNIMGAGNLISVVGEQSS